jgi:hypothetical protein
MVLFTETALLISVLVSSKLFTIVRMLFATAVSFKMPTTLSLLLGDRAYSSLILIRMFFTRFFQITHSVTFRSFAMAISLISNPKVPCPSLISLILNSP